jgi:hypothetical protein
MAEVQTSLDLDLPYAPAPAVEAGLREEIAERWGIPVGKRVEVVLRPGVALPVLTGVLELRRPPEFPWNPREPLALRISGIEFSSREIERWMLA